MENIKDISVRRISVKLPAYVQEFYKAQGEKYGVPYGNFITMTLIKHYESVVQAELLEELSINMSFLKDFSKSDIDKSLI